MDIEKEVLFLLSKCSWLLAKGEGVVFGPCIVMQYFVFCNHFEEEEIKSWSLYFAFLLSCDCYFSMSLLLGAICWSVLRDCGIFWSYALIF